MSNSRAVKVIAENLRRQHGDWNANRIQAAAEAIVNRRKDGKAAENPK